MNRLLIIDNNRMTAMTVRSALYLKAPRIQVFEASSEKEALTIAGEVNPDLILLDLNNPMLHAPTIAQALRKLPRMHSIPIVGITPMHQLKEHTTKMCSLCDDWLQKPISSSDLLSLIAQFSVMT